MLDTALCHISAWISRGTRDSELLADFSALN